MKIFSSFKVMGAALFLASCSGGEPSASDISKAMESAIKSEISQMNAMVGGLGGGAVNVNKMLQAEIKNLEKLSCTESAKDSCNCNIRFQVSGGMLGAQPREQATSVRMMRTSNGWMVAK